MWAHLFGRIPRGVWYLLASCVVLLTLAICVVLLAGGTFRWGSLEVDSSMIPVDEEVPTEEQLPVAEPPGDGAKGHQQQKGF